MGLISTFHPQSRPFHGACWQSICRQTSDDFIFLLYLEDCDFLADIIVPFPLVVNRVSGLSPRAIKQIGVEEAVAHGCEYVCFIDSDDIMLPDRIERIHAFLHNKAPVAFVHNMKAIDVSGREVSNAIFSFKGDELSAEFFRDKNASGFSNTVYQLSALADLLPFPAYSLSLDWEVIALLSVHGSVPVLDEVLTGYRQHADNVLGLHKKYDRAHLERVLHVKRVHYQALSDYYSGRGEKRDADRAQDELSRIHVLGEILLDEADHYLEQLNAMYKPFWYQLPELRT